MGFETITVAELRDKLVELGAYTVEEVNEIKGKANLVYELKKLNYNPEPDEELVTETIQEEDIEYNEEKPVIITDDLETSNVVSMTDPKWTDYVLEHFTEGELFEVNHKKYPSVAGLRRVTELLLGDIMFSGPVNYNVTHPSVEFPVGSCSVLYEIKILWKLNMPAYIEKENFEIKAFRGMAGANQSNTDDAFCIYPEAIAETRAEGRALRKALGLQNIVSIEEITTKNVSDIIKPAKTSEWDGTELINSNQKSAIVHKCEQFDIDLMKFINQGTKEYSSIDEVSKETAAAMIKELSKYQQTNDESKDIPESIKK